MILHSPADQPAEAIPEIIPSAAVFPACARVFLLRVLLLLFRFRGVAGRPCAAAYLALAFQLNERIQHIPVVVFKRLLCLRIAGVCLCHQFFDHFNMFHRFFLLAESCGVFVLRTTAMITCGN